MSNARKHDDGGKTPGDDPDLNPSRRQQHAGNHEQAQNRKGGADRFGETRAGAGNVEKSE
jgi:hypothetical protein